MVHFGTRPRLALLASAGLAVALGPSCRTPTQITIVLTTDIECARLRGVAITVGSADGSLEGQQPTTTTSDCENGKIGTAVLVPTTRGEAGDAVAIRVVAGVTARAEDCAAPLYKGCVVARRRLGFLKHERLTLPIALQASCVDVPCTLDTTCYDRECVPSTVTDPGACGAPGGCELPGADGGQPVIDSSDAAVNAKDSGGAVSSETLVVPSPGTALSIVGASFGYAALVRTAEAGATYGLRLARYDGVGVPKGPLGPALVTSQMLTDAVLGYDGTRFAAAFADPPGFVLLDDAGVNVLAAGSLDAKLLNVHGLPWVPPHWGFLSDRGTGAPTLNLFDAQGGMFDVSAIGPANQTWYSCTGNGTRFGLSWRSFTTCYAALAGSSGAVEVPQKLIATNCYNPQIAARPANFGGGWDYVFHMASPKAIRYLRLDDHLSIVSDLGVISPSDGKEYVDPVVATNAQGTTLVAFAEGATRLIQGTFITADGHPIPRLPQTLWTTGPDYMMEIAASDTTFGVLWTGRADGNSTLGPDGAHFVVVPGL